MTKTEKNKLFAFCLLIKSRRVNSIIYKNELQPQVCKELGLSIPTYRKMWKQCISLHLIKERGNHYQVIKWERVAEKLDLDLGKVYHSTGYIKHFSRFLHLEKLSTMNFKEVVAWIKECIALISLKQQEYEVEKCNQYIQSVRDLSRHSKIDSKFIKKIIHDAKESNLSFDAYIAKIRRKPLRQIVTGCYHLSHKMGITQMAANTALHGLVNKGYIKRFIKCKALDTPYSFEGFDALKNSSKGLIIPSPKKQKFYQMLGSEIKLLNKAA